VGAVVSTDLAFTYWTHEGSVVPNSSRVPAFETVRYGTVVARDDLYNLPQSSAVELSEITHVAFRSFDSTSVTGQYLDFVISDSHVSRFVEGDSC
jgi:hypothetical protein